MHKEQAQNTEQNYLQAKQDLLNALREYLPAKAIQRVALESGYSYEVVRRWFGDTTHRPEITEAATQLLKNLRREQEEVRKVVHNP